jgi:HK97 family phage major capsid protein
MVDLNRGSTGVALPSTVANQVWTETLKGSAVMSLATQVPLAGAGSTYDLVTADPVAAYVAETAAKPVSNGTPGNKVIKGYKIAVIQAFSDEMVRDKNALYQALVERMPQALATAFDKKVFAGTSPGTGHDVLSGAAALQVDGTSTLADLLAVRGAVAAANGRVNGWVVSPGLENTLFGAVDGFGRPLLHPGTTDDSVGNIFGAPVLVSDAVLDTVPTPDTLGYAGDWSTAYFGTVEGVQIATSKDATVGGINLFEQNMTAVRAEIEIGFAVRNIAKFVKITA